MKEAKQMDIRTSLPPSLAEKEEWRDAMFSVYVLSALNEEGI